MGSGSGCTQCMADQLTGHGILGSRFEFPLGSDFAMCSGLFASRLLPSAPCRRPSRHAASLIHLSLLRLVLEILVATLLQFHMLCIYSTRV